MLGNQLLTIVTSALLAASQAKAMEPNQIQMPKSNLDGVHKNQWDDAWGLQRLQSIPAIASNASWYGVPDGFHGRRMANGERFNAFGMTAAHRTLPFGTRVRVTNLSNGRTAIVRITDRGPFFADRVIDLSQGAAGKLDMLSSGTARVKLQVLR